MYNVVRNFKNPTSRKVCLNEYNIILLESLFSLIKNNVVSFNNQVAALLSA